MPKPKTGVGALVELVVIVALAIGLALGIQAFVVKPYQIPSESMVPTLEVGQRVLVNRVSFHFGDPGVGDIVVFHPPVGADRGNQCGVARDPGEACQEPTPEESDTNFIKRVVAVGGDRLRIENGIPIVNGEPVEGDWEIRPCRSGGTCNLPEEIEIPPDHYFMMGDNRGASDDSRFWGPVPRDWIIGKAFLTYWPPDRIGIF
ncbi:MAG TPA: signal peptidase I [Solirubrobacterales bacterium]